jgi:hypothetical protein
MFEKLLQKIFSGSSYQNIGFEELRSLLLTLGFTVRIKGSHHIYFKSGIAEILNLQPIGSKAKSYQVKQAREIIIKYKLVKTDE